MPDLEPLVAGSPIRMDWNTARLRTDWLHDRHGLLLLCVGSYFAIRFAQLVISPVVPAMIDAFSVSRGRIGIALTGMWVAYALSQLPSGLLGARLGERNVVFAALGCCGVASVALSSTRVYLSFAVFVLLLGVGAGLYYNAATALLSRQFDSVGRAIGVHRLGSPIAGLVAPTAAAGATVRYGWRSAFVVSALASVTVLLAFAWRVRPVESASPGSTDREPFDSSALLRLLSRPVVRHAMVLATLGEFVGLATLSFLPTFLVEHHGIGLGRASLLFSAYFAVVALCQPIGGWLSDRFGRKTIMAAMMLVGVFSYGLLGADRRLITAVPGVVLAGVAMSWAPPLQSWVVESLPEGERRVGFGLVRTVYILFGATGTAVVGALADVAGWDTAFGLLTGLLGAAFLSLALQRRSRLQADEKTEQ